MWSRPLILLLATTLALPMTAVMPPLQVATQVPEQAGSVLAAKKKNKKHKPKVKTVTKIVRQPVTQTFTNPASITIPASSNVSPYPSVIAVDGFTNGVITDVNLTLHKFSHNEPVEVDVLLAAPHLPGQNAIVMSDVGGFPLASDTTLTLDDQVAAPVPSPLVSGTFQPTNSGAGDTFPAPAPVPGGNSALSIFNTSNPNGTWQLFVVDDSVNISGSIAEGWSLQITAEADVQIKKKIKRDKKKGGKKGGGHRKAVLTPLQVL